ncbi:MAG: pilus assembly PilX N-terminal domain-containing protein [Candidatus Aminicenantes bacterium]|nr:MAG: pilus assembly PilX N-terminal domain-containing protein [Candidatus Aminicenantes bacterium]
MMNTFRFPKKQRDPGLEKGSGLIVVILVMAFLVTVGIAVITVTGVGSRVAGNLRTQHNAFNAAEAGFDAAWIAVEDLFINESWINFEGHYLVDPAGIDIPQDVNYFRKMTDLELFSLLDSNDDGTPDYGNIIFFKQEFVPAQGGGTDPRYTYTAFLMDDERGGVSSDPYDALLICIGTSGTGSTMTTSRLEIVLAVELN